METCRSCRYFVDLGHSGDCRRHAPVLLMRPRHPGVPGTDRVSAWPRTSGTDYCGDHAVDAPEVAA